MADATNPSIDIETLLEQSQESLSVAIQWLQSNANTLNSLVPQVLSQEALAQTLIPPPANPNDPTAVEVIESLGRANNIFTQHVKDQPDAHATLKSIMEPLRPLQEAIAAIEAEAARKAEEEAAPPPTLSEYPDPYTPAFSQLVKNVERAMQIYPENGFYEDGTDGAVHDYVERLLKDDPTGALKEKDNRIVVGTEVFEIDVRGGYIFALDNNGDRKDEPGTAIDIHAPHPALTMLISEIAIDQETILKENAESYEIAQRSHVESLEAEQKTRTATFLASLGLEAEQEELDKAVSDSNFNAAAFEKSALYQKLQKTGKDEEVADFIMSMTLLNSQKNQPPAGFEDFVAARSSYFQTDSIFKLFSHMNGETYSPHAHQQMLAGVGIEDNILAFGAYDTLRMAKAGDLIDLRRIIDPTRQDQVDALKAAFGERKTATREEVYDYVKDQFDKYAIRTLSGLTEKDFKEMEPEELKTFYEDNRHLLKHVSQAAEGRYIGPNGTPIYFVPYEKDFEVAYRAMGAPKLSDPSVLSQIQGLRDGPGYIPPAVYAINNLSRDEQAKLFESAVKHLSPDDIRNAVTNMYDRVQNTSDQSFLIGKLSDRINGILKDGTDVDYSKLNRNEQQAIMGAIIGEMRPELYNDPIYSKAVMNYYEPFLTDFREFRTPRMIEEYGELDQTQQMRAYMRYYDANLKELVGEEAYKTFFHEGSKLRKDYNLTYEDVKANLDAIDPSLMGKLDQAIAGLKDEDVYNYLVYMRRDDYRDMRRNRFIPQEQGKRLSQEFETVTDIKPDGTDGPGQNNPEAIDPNALDLSLDDEFDKLPGRPSGGIGLTPDIYRFAKNRFNKAATGTDLITTTTNAPSSSSNMMKRILNLLNTAEHPSTGAAERAMAQQKAAKLMEQHGITDADVTAARGQATTTAKTPTTTPAPASSSAPKPGTLYAEGGNTWEVQNPKPGDTKPRVRSIFSATGPVDPNKALATVETKALTIINPEQLDDVADLAKNGGFPKAGFWSRAAQGTKSVLGKTFKVGARLLPIVGYAFAKADEEYAMDDIAPALISSGLLPEKAMEDLAHHYDWHIGLSTFDPSGAGGDLKTHDGFYRFKSEHNLDWATMLALKPNLISSFIPELFGADKHAPMEQEEFDALKARYSEQGLEELYKNIAAKHGLPETMTVKGVNGEEIELPLGVAIRDETLANHLYAQYTMFSHPSQRQGLRYMEVINQTATLAHEIIEQQQGNFLNNDVAQVQEQPKTTTEEEIQVARNEITGQEARRSIFDPVPSSTPEPS